MKKEIIAGTMKWGKWGKNFCTSEFEKLITEYLEAGITTFDHADIYGGYTTEKDWGQAWKNLSVRREEIKIISKCGICHPSENRPEYKTKHYNYSKKHIIKSVRNSLENLQSPYLDILLLHRPSPLMRPEEIAEAYEFLFNEGMVKAIGVSNFSPANMELCKEYFPIKANQIEISILKTDAFSNGLLDYCMTHNIELQAWSPLGGGELFLPSEKYDIVTRRQRLMHVAQKYNWELDELAYLFLMHHPIGIKPVVGSVQLSRITKAQNLLSKKITDVQWFEMLEASLGKPVA
jgi:predicted oxidoreductase